MEEMFELGEGVRLFVRVTIGRVEACFELSKRVRVIEGGNDILSFPSRGGRAFEIGEDESDPRSVQSSGFGEFDVGLTFLQEFFTFRIAARELCWFVGL